MMKTLALVLTFVWMVGCANNNNSDAVTSSQATNPVIVGELLGTWSKPCSNAGTQGAFIKNSITVETTVVTMLTQLYQNSADCAGTPDFQSRADLSYVIPTFALPAVNNVDMTVNSIRGRFNTAPAVAIANASSFCGFSDWTVGVEKELSGRSCVAELPAAGQPFYQIFKIEAPDLFIGQIDAAHSGKTPETRPTHLESTPYSR